MANKIMYRASRYDGIEAFEIENETEHLIIFYDIGVKIRERKRQSGCNWFDTFQKAKDFLLDEVNTKIKSYSHELSAMQSQRNKIESLQESDIKGD